MYHRSFSTHDLRIDLTIVLAGSCSVVKHLFRLAACKPELVHLQPTCLDRGSPRLRLCGHLGSPISMLKTFLDQDIEVHCPGKIIRTININAENEALHLRLQWKKKRNMEKEEQCSKHIRHVFDIYQTSSCSSFSDRLKNEYNLIGSDRNIADSAFGIGIYCAKVAGYFRII